MANRKKKRSGFTFSSNQLGLLAGCVVAIALLAFLMGYGSGKIYDRKVSPPPKVADNDSVMPPRKQIDPGAVNMETSAAVPAVDKFTFNEKLQHETAPATASLPTGSAPKSEKPENRLASTPPAPNKPSATKKSKPAQKKTASLKKRGVKSKKITIQVGSFKNKKDADALVSMLSRDNYNAYVMQFNLKGSRWYRVRVGVYETAAIASRVAAKLERDHHLPVLIVTYRK